MYIRGLDCCGAAELVGINDTDWTPEKWLLFYSDHYTLNISSTNKGKSWIPFCYAYDVGKKLGYRSKLQGTARLKKWKKYIEDNGLGEVIITKRAGYNPNYGQRVRLRSGIFVPDNIAIRKFVTGVTGPKKLRKTRKERDAEWVTIK